MKQVSFPQIFAGLAVAAAVGCTPGAGEGGAASITGQVEIERRAVISNPAGAVWFPAADVDVFITYGDRVGPDDKVTTNFDGDFAFYGLTEGEYTIYVYSEDTLPQVLNAPDVAIVREVEVPERRAEVDLGTIRIYKEL